MKRLFSPILFVALLTCSLATQAAAQARPRGSGGQSTNTSGVKHLLFGDFKIDESKVSGIKPQNFQIVLYSISGNIVARQSISINGRYYFSEVPNGEYNLVVEMEGSEVARLQVMLSGYVKSDFRRDIELEWRTDSPPSAADYYERKPANQSLYDKAQEAIGKNDLKHAATLLNQLLRADAKDYQAWTALGLVFSVQVRDGDAEKAFRNALAEKPSYFIALLNMGKVQLIQKNFDSAVESLTKAVEINPRSADANLLLGEAYLQIKKGSKAVGYLNEAIKLDPVGKAEAHLRLATLYHGAGLKDRAVAEYEQFLVKKPDHPDKAKIRQYITENKPK